MAAPTKKIYEAFVSKIPWTIANKEIKQYFGQFGQVKRCMLLFDRDTGFHKGFCWIGYSTEEGLNNALQKEPHMLEGAKLTVQRNRRMIGGHKAGREAEEGGMAEKDAF